MIKMEASIKGSCTIAGIQTTLGLLLHSQAFFITGTLMFFPAAKNLYKAYVTRKRGVGFVRSVELNEDFTKAKFFYGFREDFKEIEVDKIVPKNIVKQEKSSDKKKHKIYIDLDLQDKELQIILDELFCNIPDTELLNAVLAGDAEFVQENYEYKGSLKFSDKDYFDFKREMDALKLENTTKN